MSPHEEMAIWSQRSSDLETEVRHERQPSVQDHRVRQSKLESVDQSVFPQDSLEVRHSAYEQE